jgi:hypothetical protein
MVIDVRLWSAYGPPCAPSLLSSIDPETKKPRGAGYGLPMVSGVWPVLDQSHQRHNRFRGKRPQIKLPLKKKPINQKNC